MLKKHGLEIGERPAGDHDEGDPLSAVFLSYDDSPRQDEEIDGGVDYEQEKSDIKIEPKVDLEVLGKELSPGDDHVMAGCDENVGGDDFDAPVKLEDEESVSDATRQSDDVNLDEIQIKKVEKPDPNPPQDSEAAPKRKLGRSRKKYNTAPDNLDCDVTVTKSETGRDILIYGGNTFKPNTAKPPSGEVTHWVCKKKKCRALLSATRRVSGGSAYVLSDTKTEHNHAGPPKSKMGIDDPLVVLKFRKEVWRIIASQPDLKPIGIYLDAIKVLDKETRLRLDYAKVLDFINRMRHKKEEPRKEKVERPKKPKVRHLCDDCGYAAGSAHILRNHSARVHEKGEEKLFCDQCTFATCSKQKLQVN